MPAGVEGRNLAQTLLEGAPLDPHRPVFNEEWHSRTVVRDGWKLVYDVLADERQLYHLAADPWCFENLYHKPETLERRAELKRLLLGFLVERIHGPYNDVDIKEWNDHLDPKSPMLWHSTTRFSRVTPLRAGASIRGGSWEMLVPFFDGGRTYLFSTKRPAPAASTKAAESKDPFVRQERSTPRLTLKSDQASPYDPGLADWLLDRGLDEMFAEIHRISCTRDWPKCEYARPSLEAARDAYARWEVSKKGMSGHAALAPQKKTGGARQGKRGRKARKP